jgi:hypothetical protein
MREMQQAHQSGGQLYLDDLRVGQRFTSGTYLIEEARIKAFAAEFDPSRSILTKALPRQASLKDWRRAAGTRRRWL